MSARIGQGAGHGGAWDGVASVGVAWCVFFRSGLVAGGGRSSTA